MSFGVAASSPARCASVSSSVHSDPPPLELDLPDPERDDISTMEFLTTIPPNAIIPIIAVAVKKTGLSNPPTGRSKIMFKIQKPGITPIAVIGMALMMTIGMRNDFVCTTSKI